MRMKFVAPFLIFVGGLVAVYVPLRLADVVRPMRIESRSMEPALRKGDRVVVARIRKSTPIERGMMACFRPAEVVSRFPDERARWVSRIVAIPGDLVTLEDGVLCVNGERLIAGGEPATVPPERSAESRSLRPTYPFTVGNEEYFVVGDNASNSFDSRSYGTVPRNAITDRILFRY
jgi:signal peptidase I